MTSKLILIASLIGFVGALAEDTPTSQAKPAALSATNIAQIKAQEFSRTLAQLKLQEVALQRATPIDNEALALIRAQQKALDQELLKLAVTPLEWEAQRLSASLFPSHPKVVAIREEIERCKATFANDK